MRRNPLDGRAQALVADAAPTAWSCGSMHDLQPRVEPAQPRQRHAPRHDQSRSSMDGTLHRRVEGRRLRPAIDAGMGRPADGTDRPDCENVTKDYRGVPAVKNVDFDLQQGRDPCAARRERRRQVDADQDHGRRRRADLRRDAPSTARRSSFATPHEALQAGIAMVFQETSLVPVDDGRAEPLSRRRRSSSTGCAASTSPPSSSCSR